MAAAAEHGEVLYAVPGSPVVAERTVELLVADAAGRRSRCCPALSFLDLAWARLGVDPVALGARLVDGRRFATRGGGRARPAARRPVRPAPRAVRHQARRSTTAPRSSCSSASACPTSRCARWRGTTSTATSSPTTSPRCGSPSWPTPVAGEVARFHELVRTLRAECPWDREQTHASLTRHLLEETYEVLEAIDHVDEEAGTGFEDARGGARRPALPGGVPLGAGRRGGPVHPGRRRPRHPRQALRPPPARVRPAAGRHRHRLPHRRSGSAARWRRRAGPA